MHATAKFFSALLAMGISINTVAAHGALVAITGANGIKAQGFGIDASTPRDGSSPNPFEQDTSIIRDVEINNGQVGVCGRTKLNGNNDVAQLMTDASNAGLPTAAADGSLTMTLHQVNQDGAGPYKCQVSADGTGADFQEMDVTTNVPGFLGLSLAQAQDFPLVAQMPAGMTCAGGPNGNACLVRCRNPSLAGPFGGCAAVTTAGAAATTAAANVTTAATAATGAVASAAVPAVAAPAVASAAVEAPAAVAVETPAAAAAAEIPAAGTVSAEGSVQGSTAVEGSASAQGSAVVEQSAAAAGETAAASCNSATGCTVEAGQPVAAAPAASEGSIVSSSSQQSSGSAASSSSSFSSSSSSSQAIAQNDPLDFKKKRFVTSRIVGKRHTGKWM